MEKGRFLSLVRFETGTKISENEFDFFKSVENDTKESRLVAVPEIKITVPFFSL